MGWFKRRKSSNSADLQQPAPSTAQDIGAGLWNPLDGPEVVRVLHDPDADLFYFDTDKKYLYGANTGGYGRRELATLYMTGKLSLSPERLGTYGAEPAVILNSYGQPVLAASEWEDGLDALLADSAFHAEGT